ncbi:unnamed protein product [Pieris macdunnoughi]|uniref:HTH CENPB-type domain-containing protein n=1 Tax=Pieris macdunnoughi TaxID=345717 RepID=A0A821WXK6_9NEOP|nr:unnamed protein product [Pieris macdunnoughi]
MEPQTLPLRRSLTDELKQAVFGNCQELDDNRFNWYKELLFNAPTVAEEINEENESGKPIRKTAKETGIPFSTLQERLKKPNMQMTKCGRITVFNQIQEKDMADQIKLLAKIFYGCTASEIKRIAYEYAVKNNVHNNFNNATQMAGKDWLKGFMKRNNLSVRKAEGTSLLK